MGADPLTFAGLAGMGDLVLTATGGLSRNRALGVALAQGETLESYRAAHRTRGRGRQHRARRRRSWRTAGSRDADHRAGLRRCSSRPSRRAEAVAELMERELKSEQWTMTTARPVQEFFSIGEVCALTDLKPHVLRYWESQFRFLNPAKNRSGNRVYKSREVELIMLVKHLLYTEKYTIEGARQRIDQYRRSGELGQRADGARGARSASEAATLLERC